MKNLVKKAERIFKSYRAKHEAYGPGPNLHYKHMFIYGRLKHEYVKFDLDIYNIAVWFHDIGRYTPYDKKGNSTSDRAYHKKLGVHIFEKEMGDEFDADNKDKIIKCIRYC